MAYGLRTYDANGNITIDVTDRTARLVRTVIVDGLSNGSMTIPEAVGKMAFAFPSATTNNSTGFTISCTIDNNGILRWYVLKDCMGATYNLWEIVSRETQIHVFVL